MSLGGLTLIFAFNSLQLEMIQHNTGMQRSQWQKGRQLPASTRVIYGHSPVSSGAESDVESSSTESENVREKMAALSSYTTYHAKTAILFF